MNFLGYDLDLLPSYRHIIDSELNVWKRFYLPDWMKGKIVLDEGAGCGETAAFYLANGASKVIAVEPDPQAFRFLESNIAKTMMNVEAIHEAFSLKHLEWDFDVLKMDIEGGEALLLDWHGRLTKPLVIESHGERLTNQLLKRFDLKRVFRQTALHAPQVSILHLTASSIPEYKTTLKDYFELAKLIVRESL